MVLALDDVTFYLHDALSKADPGEDAQQSGLSTLAELAEPSRLAELVHSILASPEAISACARDSHRHPLGFQKLMLINTSPLFELRTHVWWPGGSPGVDHIHNHRSAFVTTVIRGGYNMQVFQEDRTGMPMVEYRDVARPGTGWRLESVGMSYLRLLTCAQLRQGTSYALAPEALHRVAVPQGTLCITLLLRTASLGSTSQVFVRPGSPAPATHPATAMSGARYRGQLEALMTELAG